MQLHKWHRLCIVFAVFSAVASAWVLGTYQPTAIQIRAVFEHLPQPGWVAWFLISALVMIAAWRWPELWKIGLGLMATSFGAWTGLYAYFLWQYPAGGLLLIFNVITCLAFLILVAAPMRAIK